MNSRLSCNQFLPPLADSRPKLPLTLLIVVCALGVRSICIFSGTNVERTWVP